jgi:hypothetical protein
MDAADRAAVPVVEDKRERPWADFGIDYEMRVLSRLAGRTRVLLPAVGEDGLSERQAAAFLRGAKDAEYAAQVNLRPDRRSVFARLLADLQHVDRLNLENDAGLYAHIFFYEPAEAIILQNAVKRHLDDPRVREGLLHLVRLFPPDDVVPEPEYRGMHHLPATALRSVVEQLYALPVTVAYDLRKVSMALAAGGMIAEGERAAPDRRQDLVGRCLQRPPLGIGEHAIEHVKVVDLALPCGRWRVPVADGGRWPWCAGIAFTPVLVPMGRRCGRTERGAVLW